MTMSEFRIVWICMLTSGDMNSLSPFTGLWKCTPSSVILRMAPSDQTWKPRVGQDGLVPLLEVVQTAEGLHDVQAGTHPQMEGIAQDDLCAHFFEAARHYPLTVP